jgi:hypothetical protein
MSGIFVHEAALGWVRATPTDAAGSDSAWGPAILLSVWAYLVVGVNEEFAFRGYQVLNLAEGVVGRRFPARRAALLALVLSSVFFGTAHAANPGATVASTLGVMFGGLLLGLPYLLTGELAISIGLHTTWNLFQGTVYGFPVSGNPPGRHLLSIQQGGPDLWTGGKFGPEAGLLGVVWMLLGCGLILLWVRWRRRSLGVCVRLAFDEAASEAKLTGDGLDSPLPAAAGLKEEREGLTQ